jgi:hypothetical protein
LASASACASNETRFRRALCRDHCCIRLTLRDLARLLGFLFL